MARSSVCQPTLNKKNQLIRGPLFLFIMFFSLLYTSSPCHQSPPKIYACFNKLKYGFTMEHTTRSPGHNLHHAKGGRGTIYNIQKRIPICNHNILRRVYIVWAYSFMSIHTYADSVRSTCNQCQRTGYNVFKRTIMPVLEPELYQCTFYIQVTRPFK